MTDLWPQTLPSNMANASASPASDVDYELCSIASSNETADNLPGPGRLLGNLYDNAGRRLENGLGRVARRMGRRSRNKAINSRSRSHYINLVSEVSAPDHTFRSVPYRIQNRAFPMWMPLMSFALSLALMKPWITCLVQAVYLEISIPVLVGGWRTRLGELLYGWDAVLISQLAKFRRF